MIMLDFVGVRTTLTTLTYNLEIPLFPFGISNPPTTKTNPNCHLLSSIFLYNLKTNHFLSRIHTYNQNRCELGAVGLSL
ncbi:hypothetical protein GQ457_02G006620 [Hibiscus cannabinus]